MNTFLNIVISNVFVATVLFTIVMLFRRRIKNPAVLHALLLLILIKLITPAYWQPQFELLPSTPANQSVIQNQTPPIKSPFQSLFSQQKPEREQPVSQTELESADVSTPTNETFTKVDQPNDIVQNPNEENKRAWLFQMTTNSVNQSTLFTSLVLITWITGSASLFFLAVWRIVRFQWFLRQTQPVPEKVNQMARRLATRIGLKHVPHIEMVTGKISPLLWACFSRARIILPLNLLEQLDDAELETLLLHELAHYRRGDHWVRLVELLATVVYWWYPVLWLVRRQIRTVEEECCDAWVVQTLPEKRRSYAEVLVKAIASVSRSTHVTGATGIGSAHILEQRLKRIMCESLSGKISQRSKIIIAVVAVILLPFAPMLGQPLAKSATAQEKETLPSVQEILDGYRANIKQLMPVAMNYQLLTSESPACINQDKRALKDARLMLTVNRTDIKVNGKIYYDKEMFQLFLQQTMERVEHLINALKPEVVKRRLATRMSERGYFWSDGTSFHRRWPKNKTDKEVNFNAGRVTPPWKLKSNYRSMNLISWSKENHPPMRCWFGGGDQKDSGQGIIGSNFDSAKVIKTIAPLGQEKLDWNEPFDLHNLDAFMSKAPSLYQVVGLAELKGRSTILVDGYFTPPGKTGYRQRIRAWIDPNQGFLPLRMEWVNVDAHGKVGKYIQRHIEVLEVQQFADAHYPMRIKLQDYVYDTIVIKQQLQAMRDGKSKEDLSPTPLIPGRSVTWEVTDFTPNKPIEPEVLALEFPQGMPYRNDIDDRNYITGQSKPLPLPPKSLQVGEIAPPLNVESWLDGKSRKLSDFRGKVVVLLFMDISGFSEIPDDMKEQYDSMMKIMRVIYEKYATKGVVFLDIHPAGTNPDLIRAFQKDRQFETLAAIDAGIKAQDGNTAKKYTGDHPDLTFFLIGRDGRIALSPDTFEGEIGMMYYMSAARKLSIPLPIDESVPEEEAMHRSLKILELILSEQIDKALAVK